MAQKGLTEKEKELADRLIKTGLEKQMSRVLVILGSRGETKRREIEDITGLRQPEISIATQRLRDRGWVTKRDIKKEGKGRPVHVYYLDSPVNEIIEEIEKKEMERIEDIENNLKEIKELAGSIL